MKANIRLLIMCLLMILAAYLVRCFCLALWAGQW